MYGNKDAGSKPMLSDSNAPESGSVVKGKCHERAVEDGHTCDGSFPLKSKMWTDGPSDISGGHGGNY